MSYVTNGFDEQVLSLLKEGGVGFMPSDTIYGLSCRALDKEAVHKLHALKDRQTHKPFIILISNIEMLDLLSINGEEVRPAEKYWPGALTLVCPAPNSPDWLNQGLGTLAIRVPGNPELVKLIAQAGPLISTSANVEGKSPAVNAKQAQEVFGDNLDFYIDMGEIEGRPSTVVRQRDGKLEVIRQGAMSI